MFFVGCFFALNGLIEMLFLENCNEFAELVRTGDLDGLLLKPIDEQFLITCRRVDWGTAPNVLMGAAVMGIALWNLGWHFDAGQVATFLVTFACGTAIAYGFMLMLTSLSVWMVRNQSLMEMWWLFSSLARYPKEIFSGTVLGRTSGRVLHVLRADPGGGERAGQRDGAVPRLVDGRLHGRGDRAPPVAQSSVLPLRAPLIPQREQLIRRQYSEIHPVRVRSSSTQLTIHLECLGDLESP